MQKLIAIVLTAFLCATPRFVAASEILNVAVPDRGAWDSSYTEFGLQQGFFKEEGLDVRITYVADQAALESALMSGKVDIAVGAGFADILGAWVHGAPLKIISPEATGAPDIFWFAKVGGPVARMTDLHGQAVGFSAPGSLSNFILLTLLEEAGVDDASPASNGREATSPASASSRLRSWRSDLNCFINLSQRPRQSACYSIRATPMPSYRFDRCRTPQLLSNAKSPSQAPGPKATLTRPS